MTYIIKCLNLSFTTLFIKRSLLHYSTFLIDLLQKEDKYKSILVEYDIVGPKIATALNNDPQKEIIALKYFNTYIPAIIYNINNKNYDNAVFFY